MSQEDPNMRLYCIMSPSALKLMGGIRGKIVAQGGHAYCHAMWDAQDRFPALAQAYRDSQHARKICLVLPDGGNDIEHFENLISAYCDKTGVTLVRDAGFTVFTEPTVTCIGIGPLARADAGDDLNILKTLT